MNNNQKPYKENALGFIKGFSVGVLLSVLFFVFVWALIKLVLSNA